MLQEIKCNNNVLLAKMMVSLSITIINSIFLLYMYGDIVHCSLGMKV